MIEQLVEAIPKARFVFTCGNGGSAATAEHFTNDLFSKGIKAICLSSNTSIMTMIANDFGYEHVFRKQLEVYGTPQDLLVVFSVSGRSPNILEALKSNVPAIKLFGRPGESYREAENWHLSISHEVANRL
jgi:D-sedoheptulose 7-phosphate isomerase